MSKLSITPINPNDTTMSYGYCPHLDNYAKYGGSYTILNDGIVSPEKRSINENTEVPSSLPNGGIFMGPQSSEPWANIPITPTDTNLIHYNLRSANPPPGATEQYVSNDRMGNNYSPKIGVYWYNPEHSRGLYYMNVTNKQDAKQY